MLRLPEAADAHGWRRLYFGGGIAGILIYLYLAIFIPGTLRFSPFTIQDDARQFHLWMPRLTDPMALLGDRTADYWQSVSPPAYRLPFEGMAAVGVDPLLFGRILPALLLLLSLWGVWRLANALVAQPRTAFVAAGFLFAYLLHEDSIFSATPRAFSPPLLILLLESILARRTWAILVTLFLLALIYPSSAVLGLSVLGLAQIRRGGRFGLWLPWRSIPLLAVAAALVLAAALPFQTSTRRWDPVITVKEALALPNMNRPDGRSSIVNEDGNIGWACSGRMGLLPEMVPCSRGVPGAWLLNLLILTPLLVFAVRAARRAWNGASDRSLLYFQVLVASLSCYILAALLAFHLHLPSRYTQRILGPLEWLAIGQSLGIWLERGGIGRRRAVTALLVPLFLTPVPQFKRPKDSSLVPTLAATPPETRIAGVSTELNALPALTGRAVAAAPEQAIPWHLGYYRDYERAMRQSLTLLSAQTMPEFQDALTGLRVNYVLVDLNALDLGELHWSYGAVLPQEAAAATHALGAHHSVIQQIAGQCTARRFTTTVLLDARCLQGVATAAG